MWLKASGSIALLDTPVLDLNKGKVPLTSTEMVLIFSHYNIYSVDPPFKDWYLFLQANYK
jgi:hypothetical protein